MNIRKITYWIVLALVILQIAVIPLSWLFAVLLPNLPIRSLLSSEGIRWLIGSLTIASQAPLLAFILYSLIAWGILYKSGLLKFEHSTYQSRSAFRFAVFEAIGFLLIVFILTVTPQAPLLSITGHIFPSSFSAGMIPLLCIAIIIISISYGKIAGTLRTYEDIIDALIYGIRKFAILIILYLQISILHATLNYIIR